MNLKKIAIATAATAGLFAASIPAFANGWNHDRDHGRHYGNYHRAPVVVYRPAPMYVAPAPMYYPPAPVYYRPYYRPAPVIVAPPAPVIYGRVPVGNATISFGAYF
jgi:hypothetical protein